MPGPETSASVQREGGVRVHAGPALDESYTSDAARRLHPEPLHDRREARLWTSVNATTGSRIARQAERVVDIVGTDRGQGEPRRQHRSVGASAGRLACISSVHSVATPPRRLGSRHASHQRVHQIVETAGGARRWGRRGRLPPELACSFCGRRQRKARKLVAGPDVYICEQCVEMAEAVIRSGQATETALGPLRSVPDTMAQRRCSFCGKRRHQVTGLATSVGDPAGKLADDAAVCAECLVLCREIHAERLA